MDNALFAEERRDKIVDFINEKQRVTSLQLCNEFSVSSATIRNDLRELDERGLILRTHGGAIKKIENQSDTYNDETTSSELKSKQIIAKLTLSQIHDGDTIIIDSGTTVYEVAKLLRTKKNITVVTNDLKVASLVESYPSCEILMIGGMIRKGYHCTTPETTEAFDTLTIDIAIMGATAFSLKKGASTPNYLHATLKKKMIANSNKVILVADHTKLDKDSFKVFAPATAIDLLITDKISPKLRKEYKLADIHVLTPEEEN